MQGLGELTQLNVSDINILRNKLLIEQNNKCLICGDDISLKSHLDHKHKTSKEKIGVNGAGLVRGLLCPGCNNYLGKIENNHRRFKPHTNIIDILEGVIRYLKKDPYPFIHPKEKPKEPKLSKANFNKLKRLIKMDYDKGLYKKMPVLTYPRSGKMTIKLSKFYEFYDVEPYNK